jgi:hypothetical protein
MVSLPYLQTFNFDGTVRTFVNYGKEKITVAKRFVVPTMAHSLKSFVLSTLHRLKQ